MAKAQLLTFEHEVITMFCQDCQCCLADNTHCGVCHATKPIESLCACGKCKERALDYIEREKIRITNVERKRAARTDD